MLAKKEKEIETLNDLALQIWREFMENVTV